MGVKVAFLRAPRPRRPAARGRRCCWRRAPRCGAGRHRTWSSWSQDGGAERRAVSVGGQYGDELEIVVRARRRRAGGGRGRPRRPGGRRARVEGERIMSETQRTSWCGSATWTRSSGAARRRSHVLRGARPRDPGGRLPGPDGAVGLGQDDAAQPDRRPRPADARARVEVGGERIDKLSDRQLAALAGAPRRLRLPVLQPAAGADRRAQRRAAAAARPIWRRAERRKHVAAALDVVGLARPRRRTTRASSRAARSSASASPAPSSPTRRCCCATSRPATSTASRRRDPRPAAGAQPRARQDHRHGDPRPARRGARQRTRLPRQGRAGSTEPEAT